MSAPTKDEMQAASSEIMELVGITDLADQSGGTPWALVDCRLVELAQALAASPKILLADEPSSEFDHFMRSAEVAAVLRTVQRERGTAVLLVEHDLAMVGDVVDRTVVMDLGAMLAEGPFAEVMANPAVRHAYLGPVGIIATSDSSPPRAAVGPERSVPTSCTVENVSTQAYGPYRALFDVSFHVPCRREEWRPWSARTVPASPPWPAP